MDEENRVNPRVLWLTNLPAPYRIPIWNELSKKFNLKVVFLLKEQNWRGWRLSQEMRFSFEFLRKKSLKFNELEIIFGLSHGKHQLDGIQLVIVGGWENLIYIFTLISARLKRIPVLIFYESTSSSHRFNGFLMRRFRSKIFSLADCVVTVGKGSRDAVLNMGIPSKKILTLFNPIDANWFADIAKTQRNESKLGHRFLYVGQLIERKNVTALIEAFSLIRNPNDHLTIVGMGPQLDELRNLACQLGLTNKLQFAGFHTQNQIAIDYAHADTLVLPSINEVWGLVVNEALASGLHVVVSENAGVADFVENMQGVFVSKPFTQDLAVNMNKSRELWKGKIVDPEILSYTSQRFAEILSEELIILLSKDLNHSLTWITNIPASYRIPVWEFLDAHLQLHLIIFNETENRYAIKPGLDFSNLNVKILNLIPFRFFLVTPIYFQWYRVNKAIKKAKTSWLYFDGYESPAFFLNVWLAKKRGKKIIFGYRSTRNSHRFNGFLIRTFKSKVLSLADYVVTVGRASTQAILDMGISSDAIITLFNPVDVKKFAKYAEVHRVSEATGHRFIYVGQLIERKNIKALIDAFHLIKQPGDFLTIVGDGPLLNELRKYTERINLAQSVVFTGFHSQVEIFKDYANSDTLVLPSKIEVWGLVVNEALASGLHVVVSEAAGVSEFVGSMRGVFTTGVNAVEMATAMSQSREEWIGPIKKPEILEYTPDKYASEILRILNQS